MNPTSDDAKQFALMIAAGLPPSDAILYFLPESTELGVCLDTGRRWAKHPLVIKAMAAMTGGEWTALSPKERIEAALEKHYNEMAYFLYSNNYNDLNGEKARKATEARSALEAKLAGLAGKMDAIFQLWNDMQRGTVKRAVVREAPVGAVRES